LQKYEGIRRKIENEIDTDKLNEKPRMGFKL